MGLEAAAALAELGAVDHVAVGLGDLGHPEGFLERQVGRWLAELESYGAARRLPRPGDPRARRTSRAWLEDEPAARRGGRASCTATTTWPTSCTPPTGPEVAAIVDWEMCTIGDPLLDLGWLVATWPDEEAPALAGAIAAAGGLPSTAELVERLCRPLRPRPVRARPGTPCSPASSSASCWRARTRARSPGKAPKDVGDLLHATTLGLFARARTFMEA